MPISKRLPLPRTDPADPPSLAFTAAERRLIDRLRSPLAVQRWLNALPYNNEVGGETLRTFRGVVTRGSAHCLEAAEILVEEGVCPDLSTAIAWLCEAGLVSHRTLFFRAVDRVRAHQRQKPE